MYNIDPIDDGSHLSYASLLASRIGEDKKVALRATQLDYQPQIDSYLQNRRRLERVRASASFLPYVDYFEAIYYGNSKAVAQLKKELRDNEALQACPYCQINFEFSAIDHFLSVRAFPEFAFYANNMVPSCTTCNSKYKGASFLNRRGRRKFFNPYFDDVRGHNFLRCAVTVDSHVRPVFEIAGHTLSAYNTRVLKRHFLAMRLNRRYGKAAQKLIRRKLKTLNDIWAGSDPERVRLALLEEAEKARDENGANYWMAEFLSAASACPEFCDGGFSLPFRFP